jgi:hypothetical protein
LGSWGVDPGLIVGNPVTARRSFCRDSVETPFVHKTEPLTARQPVKVCDFCLLLRVVNCFRQMTDFMSIAAIKVAHPKCEPGFCCNRKLRPPMLQPGTQRRYVSLRTKPGHPLTRGRKVHFLIVLPSTGRKVSDVQEADRGEKAVFPYLISGHVIKQQVILVGQLPARVSPIRLGTIRKCESDCLLRLLGTIDRQVAIFYRG